MQPKHVQPKSDIPAPSHGALLMAHLEIQSGVARLTQLLTRKKVPLPDRRHRRCRNTFIRVCVLPVLRHRNGWPRDSTGMTCGSPSPQTRAGAANLSLGESRVARSHHIFLLIQLTDKSQVNSLVCNSAVGIRRYCRRSRCRSSGAAGYEERKKATSRRRSAQRTVPSPPLFGRNDAF